MSGCNCGFKEAFYKQDREVARLNAVLVQERDYHEKRMAVAEEVVGKLHKKVNAVLSGAIKLVKDGNCTDCDTKELIAKMEALRPLQIR
jgi:hypothetical protein